MDKTEECMGEFIVACSFKNVENHCPGLLHVFIVLILMGLEGFSWMNWLVCLVGEICHGE